VKYWDKPLADARMLLYALKGSGLAKMDKPYIAICRTGRCQGDRNTFKTEEEQKKWGKDHQIIFGQEHVVRFAKKASANTK